jgi:hypothetical protein
MNLRDAKAQVERDQPHLTGTAKVEAIKELRDREQSATAEAEPGKQTDTEAGTASRSPRVGRAWTWLLVFTGGMTLIAFAAWGTLSGAPSWFHALFGFQTLWAIVGVSNAYKRRSVNATGQTPL